ncbi:MAG: tetratricopeptide repeat protein [Planctomycetaceae bacterium]|nr:tetratricopeptide repeat protein [Planctomycetaceae bacterium]
MKSEHRHELQRNDLGHIALQTKPWFEKHGMQALVGLVVALVAIAVGVYWANLPKADAPGWGRLTSAQTVDEYGAVADKYADSLAGTWARLRMAELNLEDGILALFTDRELGLKDIKKAQEDFEAVLKSSIALPDSLKQRALLGLARAQEAASDGDTSAALATYRKLQEDYPESIYETLVKQKIKELESGDAKAFYAWFHSQKPKPPDFRRPNDGAAGGIKLPPGLSLPGETPDVSLPPRPTSGGATPEPAKTETPKEESKPDEAAKPEPSKGDAPVEKKADEEKPTTNP